MLALLGLVAPQKKAAKFGGKNKFENRRIRIPRVCVMRALVTRKRGRPSHPAPYNARESNARSFCSFYWTDSRETK